MRPIHVLPDTAREVLIAVNPRAGSNSGAGKVQALVELLTARGLEPEVITSLELVRLKAAQALAGGRLRAVVAAGGDGTFAELLNRTEPGTPLAVLPLGTENLVSKSLGQDRSPETACEAIVAGRSMALDAGVANGRMFMLVVGIGFDGEAARRLHADRRGHITHLSWVKPLWQTIRSYEYPELRVYCQEEHDRDDEPYRAYRCRWAFAVNLPRYALGLKFAPDAVATDGQLDVCLFERGSLLSGVRYLSGVLLRQHARFGDCTLTRCRRLRIESDRPVPYQLDGDPGGWLPLEVESLPGRATVLVPRRFAQVHGSQAEDRQVADLM